MKKIPISFFILLSFQVILFSADLWAAGGVVAKGKRVKFDYTLKIDGQVIESSKGRTPLEYVHGEGIIIQGLYEALEGMKTGGKKRIVVKPEDAYGAVNPGAFREFKFSDMPDNTEPRQGMVLELQGPDGNVVPGIVWELREESFVVNFNHPLAGKELEFDVTIVSVE